MYNQINPAGLSGWFRVSGFAFRVKKRPFDKKTTRNSKPETRNRSHQFVRIYAIVFIGIVCLHGCAPDISETEFFREHPEAVDTGFNVIELGQANSDGLSFRLLAPEALHIGYSTIWVEILDNGVEVPDASIDVTPIWGNPVQAVVPPFSTVPASKMDEGGRFEASPFFLQPVDQDGQWELHVDFTAASKSGTVVFNVDVDEDIWVQHVTENGGYYVSWVLPERPTTGNDVIQFALHRLTDSGFTPVEDAEFDLYPYMDMGAGEGHSTPFEAPVHSGDGLYTGQVNFIMSGGWDMTAYITRSAAEQDTVVFKGFTVY